VSYDCYHIEHLSGLIDIKLIAIVLLLLLTGMTTDISNHKLQSFGLWILNYATKMKANLAI